MQASATAHPNIALVKYWGKRDAARNLPAVGSLSITLDRLYTRTTVDFTSGLEHDKLRLNGEIQPTSPRLTQLMDAFRDRSGQTAYADIDSQNNFPTAAGLASSASGFAALAIAADAALGTGLSRRELSGLARLGSGSAARSLFGGFARWHRGKAEDGHDSIAEALADESYWPLKTVIAITSMQKKAVGSTDGMLHSEASSPYYAAWVDGQTQDLVEAEQAVRQRDFQRLAAVSEFSCLKMHALAMASRPGLMYWNAATVEGLNRVRELRNSGLPVFFTVDAGPQVKAVCEADAAETVDQALADISGVQQTIQCGLGPGAQLLSDTAG